MFNELSEDPMIFLKESLKSQVLELHSYIILLKMHLLIFAILKLNSISFAQGANFLQGTHFVVENV